MVACHGIQRQRSALTRLKNWQHGIVSRECDRGEEGCVAAALRLLTGPAVYRRISVDSAGNFYQIFQQNKWRLRLAREQQRQEQQAA